MRSTYERETTTYSSPNRTVERYVTRTSSPGRTNIEEFGSNGKKTTIVYDGPNYTSRTVIEDAKPTDTYIRTERSVNEWGDAVERRTTTRYGNGEVRRTVVETSPSRTGRSGTKVVYDNEPSYGSKGKTYTRTTYERSPSRVDGVSETIREDYHPNGGYSKTIRESSPGRTVVSRTYRDEDGIERTTKTIRDSSPSRVTRTIYESSPKQETTYVSRTSGGATTVTRTVREPSPPRTTVTRTYRDDSPGRSTYTRTVRENSPGRNTVTRTYRDESGARTYTRIEEDVPETVVRTTTYDNGERVTTTTYADDYPVRRRVETSDDDVVVLKYTSPYKSERTSRYETTTYYP